MTLKRGQTLQQGRYQVEKRLGQGGMATVYLAVDRHLDGRLVAIKENTDTAEETQAQFRREAVMLAHLVHPHLQRVIDHFIEPSGRQYLVMDYVEGSDLRETIRQRGVPLDETTALAWVNQVMDALDYMHTWSVKAVSHSTKLASGSTKAVSRSTPIIHRDIKPSNIKCTSKGHIVLVDFGLAKYQLEKGTLTGARAVSPGYSPVEQYIGGTDIRSDVYALGATLYTLLTGVQPPEAPALASGARLQPPRALNSKLSRNTERVILRAMRLQPAERYQSIQEMREALTKSTRLTFRVGPLGASPLPPASRWNWLWGAGIGGLLLVLGLLLWNMLARAPQPTADLNTPIVRALPTNTAPAAAAVVAAGATEESTATTTAPTATPAASDTTIPVDTPAVATPAALVLLPTTDVITASTAASTAASTPTVALATVTPLPVSMLTDVPTSTRIPTSTPIPMRTPTLTPVATFTAVLTKIPTVAVAVAAGEPMIQPPQLLLPAVGASLAARQINFQWRWEGVLDRNWGFEVRGWQAGQAHNGLHDARTTAGLRADANGIYSLMISVPESLYNASWQWTVAVVQLDPYQRIGPEAEPRTIYYQPPSPLR